MGKTTALKLKLGDLPSPQVVPIPKIVELKSALDRLPNFPTTRYYGSKKKLLPWIHDCVKSLPFETVLDGFGGTASVSLLFKAMGKEVTYHDAFHFNQHVARAVLADTIVITKDDFISFINQVVPERGFITETFKGMYYKTHENKWLDGFMKKLLSAELAKQRKKELLFVGRP